MELFELILLLLVAVLVSAVIDQVVPKISSALIQIVLGMGIALILGGKTAVDFDSELFLVLLVAPLLYDEARHANKADLWRYRKPVLAAAIGLVIVTLLCVGLAMNVLLPFVPLAAALALGAALGPTDAVAVSSLPKDLNISQRNRSTLQGEYLINDASGIVSFQFALAIAVTGTFSITEASVSFCISFFGGLIVGVALGVIGNAIRKFAQGLGVENTTFHVLFDVSMPLIVFLLAEHIHASGIIAVVCAGLVASVANRAIGPNASRLSIVSSSVWRVISFVLNGLVFVLLGTQLVGAMRSSWEDASISNFNLILCVIAITAVVLGVRFVWMLATETIRHRGLKKSGKATAPFGKAEVMSALVMTLGAPKGTITLAIMFTIPVIMANGTMFPYRNLLIFLACGVIVLTLLLANFVIPLIVPKRADAPNSAEKARQETEAYLNILRSVVEELTGRITAENRRAMTSVIHQYNNRIANAKKKGNVSTDEDTTIRLAANGWEKDYVIDLIETRKVDPAIGYRYLSRLARSENLLKHRSFHLPLLRGSIKRLRMAARSAWQQLLRETPDTIITESEEAAAYRELRIDSTMHAIRKLQDQIALLDTPSENISALILEYRRIVSSLRAERPNATVALRAMATAEDIKRMALDIEREAIQNAYEDGEIGHATAKRLRENVSLMQLDLEGSV